LNVPSGLTANFNSPKYKLNASIGNTGFGYQKRMGFNVNYRWQDEFYFEGTDGKMSFTLKATWPMVLYPPCKL